MGVWVPQAGATLHIPSGPQGRTSGLHLFIALNDPRAFPGYGTALCMALVSVTSTPDSADVQFDNTCILQAGCHPAIRHTSYVYYRQTRMEQVRDIEARLEQSVYRPGEPVSAELLQRVRAGLHQSKFTARAFKLLDL
ncbi:MAG: hypothetical protein RLZZ126_394 [Pseudomonadota bacterium]|jgi:hypothetical protein